MSAPRVSQLLEHIFVVHIVLDIVAAVLCGVKD